MSKCSYEKPLRKNPFNITIKQHFHAAHAISKFYNNDSKVEVFIKESNETVLRGKSSSIFCAKRTWDQRAEHGFMASIESAFFSEIDNIKTIKERNHMAISEYFFLWHLRYSYMINPKDDIVLNGVNESGLSRKQEECIESNHGSYIREGGISPARFMNGFLIQRDIDYFISMHKHLTWGLLKAEVGEFVVADYYEDNLIVPVDPQRIFVSGYDDAIINLESVKKINRISIGVAEKFYFARDLSKCPW